MFKLVLLFCLGLISFPFAEASIPPTNILSRQETSPFPNQQTIILNALTKGSKGCLQQGKFTFPEMKFFTDNFQFSQTFDLKDANKKVTGHYRADIDVSQLNRERTRFKVVVIVVDTDKNPKDEEYVKGIGITFMSAGKFFANIVRFKNVDPKLGWNEVLIGDDLFFDTGKKTQ